VQEARDGNRGEPGNRLIPRSTKQDGDVREKETWTLNGVIVKNRALTNETMDIELRRLRGFMRKSRGKTERQSSMKDEEKEKKGSLVGWLRPVVYVPLVGQRVRESGSRSPDSGGKRDERRWISSGGEKGATVRQQFFSVLCALVLGRNVVGGMRAYRREEEKSSSVDNQ